MLLSVHETDNRLVVDSGHVVILLSEEMNHRVKSHHNGLYQADENEDLSRNWTRPGIVFCFGSDGHWVSVEWSTMSSAWPHPYHRPLHQRWDLKGGLVVASQFPKDSNGFLARANVRFSGVHFFARRCIFTDIH